MSKSKARIVKIENPLVCGNCGSSKIHQLAWVDPNTQAVESFETGTTYNTWCMACETHSVLVPSEEFNHNQSA